MESWLKNGIWKGSYALYQWFYKHHWILKEQHMLNGGRAEAQMSKKQNELNEKERDKVFSRMISRGKIRAAIRYISEREKGGILMPGDTNEKTGDLIKETLAAKHPEARDVDMTNLPDFDSCPALIDTVVTEESAERVTKKLSGSAGLSGVNSISISHWLLKFRGASMSLRKIYRKTC